MTGDPPSKQHQTGSFLTGKMPYFANKPPKIAYSDNFVFHSHVFVSFSIPLHPESLILPSKKPTHAGHTHECGRSHEFFEIKDQHILTTAMLRCHAQM